MASVSDVELVVEQGPSESTREVTVSYLLSFDAADSGRRFRLVVMLMGEDRPGDEEGAAAPQWLYTFVHGKSRGRLIVAEAGIHRRTEKRVINRSTLDEDPGFDLIRMDMEAWLRFPHKDEVYAQVTLIPEPCQARSDVVDLVF